MTSSNIIILRNTPMESLLVRQPMHGLSCGTVRVISYRPILGAVYVTKIYTSYLVPGGPSIDSFDFMTAVRHWRSGKKRRRVPWIGQKVPKLQWFNGWLYYIFLFVYAVVGYYYFYRRETVVGSIIVLNIDNKVCDGRPIFFYYVIYARRDRR